MTPAQLQTLKAYILADQSLSAQIAAGNFQAVADQLNQQASPTYVVWRSNVSIDETGNAWQGTDIDGMSALNMQRLQLLISSATDGVFDMRRADRRVGFENPFGTSANNASRVAMRAVGRRTATVAEKLLSTGTGSEAAPAITTFEGDVGWETVKDAWEA